MNNLEKALIATGNSLAVLGTATQTNEILQIISTVITILGGIITLIVIPFLNWYKKAKKDGKIEVSEIIDGAKTVNDGIDKLKEKIKEEENQQ